jgi:chromosome segregation ATPase
MAYRETLRNAELIIKDEGERRLRLRILMLENENDDLHEQLAMGDDRIDVLEQENQEIRSQLDRAQEDVLQQENELRTQSRELNNLKVSVIGMHDRTL